MKKSCLGIDVDKKTFKVSLILKEEATKKILGSHTFSNSSKGYEELLDWVNKKFKGQAAVSYVMEATGVYHEHLAHFIYAKGHLVHIILPLKAKRYLQSLGIRSKTDQIDAKGLAMMGIEQDLEPWQPGTKKLLELRSLTRQIEALQDHRTALKNQLEGAKHAMVVHKSVLKSLDEMISQTAKQITKLEKHVEKLIASDPFLKEKYELVTSIKGVGIMTFAVIASETNGFALFKNQRQLVCYSGYDVLENQSGQRVGKTRISKKGNTHMRRILHLAAWSVVKHKTKPFHQLYERVYERTGIKMKGYVAVQRKLLVMIYTLWKKNERFDPDFGTSGNHEPKSLCSVGSEGTLKETASTKEAALDGLPCNQLPEALCSVLQN
jgi:transposase